MSNSGGDIGAEILFGNVNERGELDNPDLDPETRKYLSSLTGSLAEKFFGDVIGIRGEKSDKADNTDYNKKSANAVDYEDIDELAEDDARPASNAKFQNVDALALKKKRLEEEDYDYDGEKPAQSNDAPATPGAQKTAAEPTSPPPEPEEPEDTPEEARMKKEKKKQTNKFSSMLRSLRSLSEVSKRLRNAPTTVTPDMYSYQIGNEGPILKFSEMFAPEGDISRPRKTVKFPEDRIKYDYAKDEVQVFEVPLDPSEARTVQTAESIATEEKEKREETGEIGFPMKKPEDLVDKAIKLKSHDERFELVEQYEWEGDIMWDVDGAQSMEVEDTELSNSEQSPLRMSTTFKSNEISFAPTIEVPSWASVVSLPEVQVKPETDQSESMSVDIKPDPSLPPTTPQPQTPLSVFNNTSNHSSNIVNNTNSNMEDQPPVTTPLPFTAAGEISQAAIDEDLKHPDELLPMELEEYTTKNVELSSGKWLSDVVWDDTSPSAKKIHFRLVLDLNDDQMIFEDENQDLDRLEGAAPGAIPVKRGRGRSGKRRHLMLPNRVLMSGIFMGRGREADKFNLSNDNYYLTKALQMRKRVEKTIQHSLPAWKIMMVKTHLEPPELREFHRPRTKFPLNVNLRVIPAEDPKEKGKKKGASGLMRDLIRHRKDLSAREGRVILTEYVEEFPPMLNNLGMGSKIRNYYRKQDRSDNPTLSFNDGDNIMLEEEDMSPFLGDIPKGTTVQAIENNLYKAPMFRHNARSTDFLLIKTADNKFAIREIPTAYTVGQLQPLIEVPAPNSRTANQFIKNRLQSFVYRVFREKRTENPSEQPNLKITDVATAFPGQSDNSIRKRLKHCAEFRRGGDDCGSWLLKDSFQLPSDEEIRKMISPEEVCAYESMLSGAQRLHDFGIERLHQVTPALQAAVQSVPAGHPLRKACKFIEEELQLTSWNLTQNFINAMQGKGLLQITGFGDPSGRGEAYSYLRLAQKVANPKIEKDKEPKAIVTGTDADLRKMSLQKAREVLLEFGLSEEEVDKLGRWKRIAKVREFASELKATGGEGNTSKFARGNRYNMQHHQQQYNTKCQKIFENQIRELSTNDPNISDYESDEGEDEDLLAELERDLDLDLDSVADENSVKHSKRRSTLSEEELNEDEARELDEFLAETRNSGKPGVGIIETKITTISAGAPNVPTQGTVSAIVNDGSTGGQVVKRTVTTRNPDGSFSQHVEIIRDPELINQLKQRARRQRGAKRFRLQLSEEEEQRRILLRREKRRLQEKLRRQKKNLLAQKVLKERFEKGILDGGLTNHPNYNPALICSRCGMVGHMKTNRVCPLWTEEDSGGPEKEVKVRRRRRGRKPKEDDNELDEPEEEDEDDDEEIEPELEDDDDDGDEEEKPEVVLEGTSGLKLKLKKSTTGEEVFKNAGSRKRQRGSEDAGRARKRSSRRGTSAEVYLSNLLEECFRAAYALEESHPFRNPVSAKEAPDYYEIVQHPIDMGEVRKKIRDMEYKDKEEFLADFEWIRLNCFKYNEQRNPHLIPMVEKVYATIVEEVQKRDLELTKLSAQLAAGGGAEEFSFDEESVSAADYSNNNTMHGDDSQMDMM